MCISSSGLFGFVATAYEPRYSKVSRESAGREMAPSFVTYGEKPEALEAKESSAGDGCDKPRAIIAAKSTATSRLPMICRRGMLMSMVCISYVMRDDSSSEARGPGMPPSVLHFERGAAAGKTL